MALLPAALSASLERDWFPPADGPWHEDVRASADALAGAVATWFAQAQAAGLPCATAGARRGQLGGQLVSALQAQGASAAGQQVAQAFAAYVTGQAFGPGMAAAPLATAAGGGLIATALATLDLPQPARADLIAGAHQLVAASSLVTFPGPPPFTAPVT